MTREEMRDRLKEELRRRIGSQLDAFPRALDQLTDGALAEVWPEVERLRKYVTDARDRLASARQFRESERDYQRLMERAHQAEARWQAVADLIARYDDAPGDAYIPIGLLRDATGWTAQERT